MAKLYPPYIEGTIPAFYKDEKGTGRLTVPFSMNKAVNKSEVIGFQASIKTVQSNSLVLNLHTTEFDIENNYEVYFTLDSFQLAKLNVGQFYKLQLAYKAVDGVVGYYSTVGVVKYTTKPILTIDGLVPNAINMHKYEYIGHYAQIAYTYTPIRLAALDDGSGRPIYEPNTYYIISNDGYSICTDDLLSQGQTYYSRSTVLDTENENYKDTSEKEYSYQFILTDRNENIVADSGVKLHNNSTDLNPYESYDSFAFPSDLVVNASYYIQYIVTTNNNMTITSPKYRLMQKTSIAPEIDAEMIATLNTNNGYINLQLKGAVNEDGLETAATGAFLITRACSDDGFKVWNEVFKFVLHGQHPSRWLWNDYTIEQGKKYQYSLQQYNDAGLYSARILSNIVEADFEDIFLYDGFRQLKIRYNPKMSSFKTDLLETKIETIGSKYPFIFRNGNVSYKEFPISGLISYQSDEENLFMNDEDLGLIEKYDELIRPGTLDRKVKSTDDDYFMELSMIPSIAAKGIYDDVKKNYVKQDEHTAFIEKSNIRTTDLTNYNISAERIFKLAVLDWLNNGEPKLFRSPTEGNYIVRLMNVSLSPEDQLGRMLHNFSATAYEIADCNYNSLNNFGIIEINEPNKKQLRWQSVPLSTTEDKSEDDRYAKFGNIYYAHGELLHGQHAQAVTVRFTDMRPGSLFYINVPESLQNTDNLAALKPYSYVVGATGAYLLDDKHEITSIMIPIDARYNGMLTYSYYNDAQNVFNEIESIEINEIPSRQFIGGQPINIIKQIEDVKTNFITFYYLHFAKRFCANAYYKDGVIYRNKNGDEYSSPIDAVPDDATDMGLPYGRLESAEHYEDPLMLYRYEVRSLSVNGISFVGLERYGRLPWQKARYYRPDPLDEKYYVKDGNNYIDIDSYYYLTEDTEVVAKRIYYTYSLISKRYTKVRPVAGRDNPKEKGWYVLERDLFTETRDFSNYWVLPNDIKRLLQAEVFYSAPNASRPLNSPILTDNQIYYIEKPFIRYYDHYNPQQLIVDQDTYNRLAEAVLLSPGVKLDQVQIYGTSIHINGKELELDEIEEYGIDHPIMLETVTQDCGVVLECGYETQTLTYSIEHTNSNVVAKKLEYLKWRNILSSAAMNAATANGNDEAYADQLAIAREMLPLAYKEFIETLQYEKDLWEASTKL